MNRNQTIHADAGLKTGGRVRRRFVGLDLKGRLLVLVLAIIATFTIYNLALLNRLGGVIVDTVNTVQMHVASKAEAPASTAGGVAARIGSFQKRELVLLVLLAAVAGTTAVIFVHRLLEPLSDMRKTTRRIADGHLDQSVAIHGNDDIGAIGALINDMAANQQEVLLHMWNQTHHSLTLIERIGRGVTDAARNDGLGALKADLVAVKKSMESLQVLMDGVKLYKVRIDGGSLDSGPPRR